MAMNENASNESAELYSYLVREIGVRTAIPMENLRVMVTQDASSRLGIVSALAKGLSQPSGIVSYPATWWQALKHRWFPKWLTKLFPIKWRQVETIRFCPHFVGPDNEPHLRFLDGTGEAQREPRRCPLSNGERVPKRRRRSHEKLAEIGEWDSHV